MKKKILIVASTMVHIEHFHLPYISNLSENYDVKIMSDDVSVKGNKSDFVINFKKKIFSLSNFLLVKKIRKILTENKFDVIFLNTCLASFFVRLAVKGMKKCNKPYVVNIVHGYLFNMHGNFFKKLFYISAEKFVRNQTNAVVVMNEEDNLIARKYNLSAGGIYKINGMGVDVKRFEKSSNFSFKNENKVVFSYIGELYKRKNQKFIIKFIKSLKDNNEKPKLYLIGSGKQGEELKKYSKKLGVENEIVFVGYDYNILPYLENSSYYISASKIEGLPFNIVEAMYNKKIVLASNVKGARDIIVSGKNAFLYENFDINDLLRKYYLIKDNNEIKDEIAKNAKSTAKNYILDAVFDKNISLFRRFIDEN